MRQIYVNAKDQLQTVGSGNNLSHMFAFIDESGNTGPNLFDSEQPVFYSVAVISKRDLDIEYAGEFSRLANLCGASTLHAAELGGAALEKVLPEIQRMIKRDNVRFFLGVLVKRDSVLAKLADTLLDSHDNRAVPWSAYNFRGLRLMLVFKLSVVANENSLREFWDALMEGNPNRAQERFVRCLQGMKPRVGTIPDARSRQIIGDAIQWAIENPEAFSVHSQRSARLGHLPLLNTADNKSISRIILQRTHQTVGSIQMDLCMSLYTQFARRLSPLGREYL